MKRYISAILIPCLLMQLIGCYSYEEMSLEQLKNFNDVDDIVITSNGREIIINRCQNDVRTMNWVVKDSVLHIEYTLKQSKINESDSTRKPYITNRAISYNDIQSIQLKSPSIGRSILLGFGILLGVALLFLGIFAIGWEFEMQ